MNIRQLQAFRAVIVTGTATPEATYLFDEPGIARDIGGKDCR